MDLIDWSQLHCFCVSQALEKDERFDKILKALGLAKRGTGGESSLAEDSVYDVSNIARLGQSEVR